MYRPNFRPARFRSALCTGRPSGRLLSSPLFSPLLPRRARLPRRAALTHNHQSPDHPSPPAPPKPSPPHPACPDQIRREVRLPSAHFAKGTFRRRTISTKTPLPTPREAPLAPLIVLADLQVGSSPPPSAFFPPPLHPSQTPSSEPAPFAGEGPQPKPIQKPHAKPIFLPPSPPKKNQAHPPQRARPILFPFYFSCIPRTSASIASAKRAAQKSSACSAQTSGR